MAGRIAFITKAVVAEDESFSDFEAHGWRLLAFLIWATHQSGGKSPPRFLRRELQAPLGDVSEVTVRNAVSEVRAGILRAAGEEARLSVQGSAIGLTTLEGFSCDLVDLLRAADEGDRRGVADLLEVYGAATLDILRKQLKPRRPEEPAWLGDLIDHITSAVANRKAAASSERIDPATRKYLDAYVERCATLDLRQIGAADNAALPLEDVYVSLSLGPESATEVQADYEATRALEGGRAVRRRAQDDLLSMEEARRRPPVHFGEEVRRKRWMTIVGDPGAGKSTLLHWLALYHARALRDGEETVLVDGHRLGVDTDTVDLGPSRLPILVRVAEYAKAADADGQFPELVDYLGHHRLFEEPLPGDPADRQRLIRRYLSDGRALVLVDGLDEIADSTRRQAVARRIETFARDHVTDPQGGNAFSPWGGSKPHRWWEAMPSEPAVTGGNQMVATSRRHAYKQTPLVGPFQVLEVRPLDAGAVDRFCTRWTLAVERAAAWGRGEPPEQIETRAGAAATTLVEAIHSDRDVRRLAENPLLLTVLAMVHRATEGELPNRRLELFERATRVLVGRRSLSWDFDQMCDILGPFAVWLHEHHATGYASGEELEDRLIVGLSRHVELPRERVLEFLDAAHSQAGVLVELGPGRYGFAHNTFREFFAAIEVSRELSQFRSWLLDHLHDVAWIEVVLMGVAATARRHPEATDELMRAALEQQPELEELIHHDLLLVADCLAEIREGSRPLVMEVAARLLRAGTHAADKRLAEFEDRIVAALGRLLERRPEDVKPALVSALYDDEVDVVASRVIAAGDVGGEDVLAGLQHVCRTPRRAPTAFAARASAAMRLAEAGAAVDETLRPIGSLFESGGPLRDALLSLRRRAPRLAEALAARRTVIDPALFHLARFALTTAERLPDETPEALEEQVIQRALAGLAPPAVGSDFSTRAMFVEALDAERAHTTVAARFAEGELDAASTARLFADAPAFLPPVEELPRWALSLPREQALALLERHHPTRAALLLDVAWREVADPSGREGLRIAERVLADVSARFGYLPASRTAVKALRTVLGRDDEHTRSLSRMLVARLEVPFDAVLEGQEDPREELEEMLTDESGTGTRIAAVMLAQYVDRPLTVEQYDLIATAVVADDGMRLYAARVLTQFRTDAAVPEEVVRRALAHHHAIEGDAAAKDLHWQFAAGLRREDVDRAAAAVAEPYEAVGYLSSAVAETLLSRVNPEDARRASGIVAACRRTGAALEPAGIPLKLLEPLCGGADEELRLTAATALAEEAVLAGETEPLERVLLAVAEVDPAAAAVAARFGAACLPASPLPHQAAIALRRVVEQLTSAAVVGSAAALLILDVLDDHDAQVTLDRLASHTVSPDEMAAVLLESVSVDHQWGALGPAAELGPEEVVRRRIAAVARLFAASETGMYALAGAALVCCGGSDWSEWRAAAFLLDEVAATGPGLFLKCTRNTHLRERLLQLGASPESWSVRWLVASLISHFRELDQAALDVLAAASRDYAVADAATVERCRSLTAGSKIDLSALHVLIASSTPRTVLIGATLLPAVTSGDDERRRKGIEVLSTRLRQDDALLDGATGSDGRTLRDVLVATVSQLVWKQSDSDLDLGAPPAAASPGGYDEPDEFLAGLSGFLSDIVSAMRAGARHDWLVSPTDTDFEKLGLSWTTVMGTPPGAGVLLYEFTLSRVLRLRIGRALMAKARPQLLDGLSPDDGVTADAVDRFRGLMPNHPRVLEKVAAELVRELESRRDEVKEVIADALVSLDLQQAAADGLERLDKIVASGAPAVNAGTSADWTWARHFRGAGWRLEQLGMYALAERAYKRAFLELERAGQLGELDEHLIVHDLADARLAQGDVEGAIELYERALAGKDQLQDVGTTSNIRTLVALLRAVGRRNPEEVIGRVQREIEARLASSISAADIERLRLARVEARHAVGRQLLEAREHLRADDSFRKALEELAALREDGGSLEAAIYYDLAASAEAQGDRVSAVAAYERALEGYREREGLASASTTACLVRLILAIGADDDVQAGERLERELEVRQSIEMPAELREKLTALRPALPHLAGRRLSADGKLEEAEQAYLDALTAHDTAGTTNPHAKAVVWWDLANVARRSDRLPQAYEYCDKALAALDAARGASDPAALTVLVLLLDVLGDLNPAHALERLKSEVAKRGAAGLSPHALSQMLAWRPGLRVKQGRRLLLAEDAAAADDCFLAALQDLEELGELGTHQEFVIWHDRAAAALADRPQVAIERYERALKGKTGVSGPGAADTVTTLAALCRALARDKPGHAVRRLTEEIAARREHLATEELERLEKLVGELADCGQDAR